MRNRIFHHRRDLDHTEVCDLGCKHEVFVHEVKSVEVYDTQNVTRNYDNVTTYPATVKYAVDAQGRKYWYESGFDGPGVWNRSDGKKFLVKPYLTPARDINGRFLK